MLVKCDVREVWQQIQPGLLQVKALTPAPLWGPEDIYHACMAGTAAVYTDPDGPPSDFVILQPGINPYTAEVELTVWIAYSLDPEASSKHLDDILRLARGIGAKRLIMQSPRKGFSRSRLWKSFAVEYHMDVPGHE